MTCGNTLESSLGQLNAGTITITKFLSNFAIGSVFLPSFNSASDPYYDFIYTDTGSGPAVVALSSIERMQQFQKIVGQPCICIEMIGADFLQKRPAGCGIIFNPEQSLSVCVLDSEIQNPVAQGT